jgi:hypothetical protein
LVLDSIVRVNSTAATPINLTTQGTVDWAYWNSVFSSNLPLPPSNSKNGGTAIGDLGIVGGTALQKSGSAVTTEQYSFTDGTNPVSATNVNLGGGLVFNSDLGSNSSGKGITLQVAGNPATEQIITLYLGGFGATGNLSLNLDGFGVTFGDNSQIFVGLSPKEIAIYTLRFRTDNVGEKLTISYTASDSTSPFSHVGIEAITVAAVPEPSALALGAVGLAFIFRRRRVKASLG